MDENIWHPSFCHLFTGKIWPALFLETIAKTQPLPLIYKEGDSSYGSRVKLSKNNAISKKLIPFKLLHKMITKSMQAQNSIANSLCNYNFTVNSFVVNSYTSIKDWNLKIYWWWFKMYFSFSFSVVNSYKYCYRANKVSFLFH